MSAVNPNCKLVNLSFGLILHQSCKVKNATRRFPVFVANRLAVINEQTELEQQHFVPSKTNPADFATRHITFKCFSESRMWLFGPSCLWHGEI